MVSSLVSYLLPGVVAGWISYEWYIFTTTKNKLSAIPTVGSETFILSYISAWRSVFSGRKIMQEGYDKYPNGVFKINTLETASRWLVIVNDKASIQDIKNADESELSMEQFTFEMLQTRHIFGEYVDRETYHVGSINGGLTRSLSARFADVFDEVERSFKDIVPANDDWTSHNVFETFLPVVCRTSNRIFLGEPLCRDPEYMEIQQGFASRFMIAAAMINLFPSSILKGIAGKLLTNLPTTSKRLSKFLDHLIDERLRMDAKHGKRWEGRPNDLISWLLDFAPSECSSTDDLTYRIIILNFAAIHITSLTLSNALLELAARPEYIGPLRKEVEEIIENHGWTKEAMGKMRKLDSFLKESSRVNGFTAITLGRKAMKDIVLSNGTVIPAGASVAAPTVSIHEDPVYQDGNPEFNGFRFSEKRDEGAESGDQLEQFRHQMVTPTSDFLIFGYGKHACPGRFFAVNELKCMMTYVLINYDVKLPEKPNPPAFWIGMQRVLSSDTRIMFKKRAT